MAQPASAIGPRPDRVDDRRRLLHRGLHAGVAAALARQPPTPAVGRRSRLWPAWPMPALPARTTRGRTPTWLPSCRSSADQFSGTPYPPTGAASGAVALSKLVGRVEWVADNTAMTGDGNWSTEPLPARAVTEQVAETLHQVAALICDGEGHPVHDPARIAAVQGSTRATGSIDGRRPRSRRGLADRSGDGGAVVLRPARGVAKRTRASPARSTPASTPGRWASPPRSWRMRRSRQPAPSRRAAAAWAWPTSPLRRPWRIGCSRTSRSAPSGSAMPCAARWAWPWPSAVVEVTNV